MHCSSIWLDDYLFSWRYRVYYLKVTKLTMWGQKLLSDSGKYSTYRNSKWCLLYLSLWFSFILLKLGTDALVRPCLLSFYVCMKIRSIWGASPSHFRPLQTKAKGACPQYFCLIIKIIYKKEMIKWNNRGWMLRNVLRCIF